MAFAPSFLEELRKRGQESKVYKEFQLTGLLLAELLGDEKHKSLYIRLAKTAPKTRLIALAKDVSERRGIKNKGAYFMRVWKEAKSPRQKIVIQKGDIY